MKIFLIISAFVIIGLLVYYFSAYQKNSQDVTYDTALVNPGGKKVSDVIDRVTAQKKVIAEKVQKRYPQAPELVDPSGFINTGNITLAQARADNKLVLLHFWTYGCVNCKRTLGHLNEWYEKYHNDGLEIIGVHYPEFSYERKVENVKDFVVKNDIRYPIILDNNAGTWNAYKNRYWPHRYVIDQEGNIIFDHIGEGKYAETESVIKEVLYNN